METFSTLASSTQFVPPRTNLHVLPLKFTFQSLLTHLQWCWRVPRSVLGVHNVTIPKWEQWPKLWSCMKLEFPVMHHKKYENSHHCFTDLFKQWNSTIPTSHSRTAIAVGVIRVCVPLQMALCLVEQLFLSREVGQYCHPITVQLMSNVIVKLMTSRPHCLLHQRFMLSAGN